MKRGIGVWLAGSPDFEWRSVKMHLPSCNCRRDGVSEDEPCYGGQRAVGFDLVASHDATYSDAQLNAEMF